MPDGGHIGATRYSTGSLLLTRLDLADDENVKDAVSELRRAANDPARLATWAAKWGEALCERVAEAAGPQESEELEDVQTELTDLEKVHDTLRAACEAAIRAVDTALSGAGVSDKVINQVNDAVAKIEAAL